VASLRLPGVPGTGSPLDWNSGEFVASRNVSDEHFRNAGISPDVSAQPLIVPRMVPAEKSRPLIRRATPDKLAAARNIVKLALAASDKLNRARVANPRRNRYTLTPGTSIGRRSLGTTQVSDAASPALLEITPEIAAAAALVAEAEVGGRLTNLTARAAAASSGTYWMQR
jgi:hypothetical protein